MPEFILVQTSIDSQEAAQQIADKIIEGRMAACCWVSGPIRSTYWWNGVIEHAQEWVCNFKTRKELYADLEQAIRALHTYEEPEIIATPIVAGSQPFLAWLARETTQQQG